MAFATEVRLELILLDEFIDGGNMGIQRGSEAWGEHFRDTRSLLLGVDGVVELLHVDQLEASCL